MCVRLLLQELTRGEIRAIAATTMVVLPVGAVEQHGPHLPTGTDFFVVEHLARMATTEAARDVPVVVAPTLPFGSSHHHLPFGGTLSLGTELYYRVVYDLVESLISSGFRKCFILNGHGGNSELVQLVARDLALKHPVHVAAASYWSIARDAFAALGDVTDVRIPGHAGAFETSLIMALRPELVARKLPHREIDATRLPSGAQSTMRVEMHGSWQHLEGYTDSPDRGNPDIGNALLGATIQAVVSAMIEFYRAEPV